jgi:predicted glycoside hydrolase/deacetylase ChbG (UPF0249 family)
MVATDAEMMSAVLVIDADDYGYAPAYDAGIVEAARAGAIDGASVMAMRRPDVRPLQEAGIALGLHLERHPAPAEQAAAFAALAGGPPAYLDGHHHVHADDALAEAVGNLALELEVPVRSVDAAHRRALRARGIPTPDRLVGRLVESEPALPSEIAAWLAGSNPAPGVTEWLVHPGHPDASAGSAYDGGRGEDLALLLELGDRGRWAERGISRCSLGRAPLR